MERINKYCFGIHIALFILISEILLGGIGRLFGFPIRYIVFAGVSIVGIKYWYNNRIEIDKDSLKWGLSILIYVAIGILVGVIRGNGVINTISDTTNFFAILYTYLIIIFINYDKEKLYKLIDLFINITALISIITILIFIWSFVAKQFGVDSVAIIDRIESKLKYGFISGWLYNNQFARVYLPNGIYMQIALALLLQQIFNPNTNNKKSKFIKIFIILLAILSSGTRGYWLGTAIVFFLTLFTLNKEDRKIYIKALLLGIGVIIIFLLLIPNKNSILKDIIDRITSIVDFNNDISNNIRRIQINHMLNQFYKTPIIGSGFGKELVGYTIETGRNGIDFEVYYIELLYKTGILGLISFIGILGYNIIIKPLKLLKSNILECKDIMLINGWLIGTLSTIIISITNPYIKGNYGIFILDMMIVIYVVIKNSSQHINRYN